MWKVIGTKPCADSSGVVNRATGARNAGIKTIPPLVPRSITGTKAGTARCITRLSRLTVQKVDCAPRGVALPTATVVGRERSEAVQVSQSIR